MYSSPNMRSVYRSVPLDINPPTFMRGPGTTTGMFALECGMDDLAVRLGMDPIELRIRNEPERDQFENVPFSTRRLVDCFSAGRGDVRLVPAQSDAPRDARRCTS